MNDDIFLYLVQRFNEASYNYRCCAAFLDYADSNSLYGSASASNLKLHESYAYDSLSARFSTSRIVYQVYYDLLEKLVASDVSYKDCFYWSTRCGLEKFGGDVPIAFSYSFVDIAESD